MGFFDSIFGGGGGSIDTTGQQMAAAQAMGYGGQIADMARQNFAQGQQMYGSYGRPTYDALLQMVGLGGQQGEFVDPMMSKLVQPGLYAGQQAASAAKKNLLNQNLGPGAQAAGMQQIDLQRMGNAQNLVYTQVQQAIQQLLGGAQQGLALQGAAPGQMQGAVSAMGVAGGLESQIGQLQMQAAQANNLGLSGIFNTIGTITGLGLGGYMSGGKSGGGGGGGGYDPSFLTTMFNALPVFF